jgi:hypothetical protein
MPYGVAFSVMFVVLVIPHVLQAGLGHSTPLKLTIAVGAIAGMVFVASRQFARYLALDELEQRVELESLATAFVGTFCVFVAYWLLQAAGLFPPLNGMFFVPVMFTLRNLGLARAWQQILRRTPK